MKHETFLAALFLLSFATACNKGASEAETPDSLDEDGPMEKAGEAADEAAEDAEEGLDEAAEETKETAEEIADDLDEDPVDE